VFEEFLEVAATDTGEDCFAREINPVVHIAVEETDFVV